ncbi:MAG TPA: iron ABC transporter permease [Nocardioidaceae bacterium]|nr:iron ABC transporter permease [Nocardioidaceae bacterium]
MLVPVAAAAVAALALVPLGYVVWYAVTLGPAELVQLLVRPRVGELLRNTGALLVGVVGGSIALGVLCAWLVERTDLPGRRLWHALFAAPLAVPAFVNSYGWVSLTSGVQSYPGAVLVVTLSYYPLVYLPMVAALRGLDPALEEVALSLGRTRWSAFTTVVLRGARPALLGGALLVGLHVLAEFGALQMLAFPTFTTAIYDQYRSTFASAAANALAVVLVLGCLLLLLAELRLRGQARVARVGAGSARRPARQRLGRARPAALLGSALLVVLALGVPLASLVRWLLVGSSTAFPMAELTSALATTAGLALGAAALAALLAFPVAWLAVRHRGPVPTLLERAAYTAHALPGIVVALALVTVSIRVVQPLYQTLPLLLVGYAILFLPRALVTLRSTLEQAPPVLEDVARSLGLGPVRTFTRVTLPMVRSGLGSGAALVFLAVSTELTATLLLAPTGTATLATEFWANASSVRYGAAAPFAVLLVLLSLPATFLLGREAQRGRPS